MAMSPKEYYKLVDMASVIRRQISDGVKEIDNILKMQAKVGETDWVVVCLDRGLGKEVYEGIVKDYLVAGWHKVYVAVVYQHADSTYTEFVLCTKESANKFENSCDFSTYKKWEIFTEEFLHSNK